MENMQVAVLLKDILKSIENYNYGVAAAFTRQMIFKLEYDDNTDEKTPIRSDGEDCYSTVLSLIK